MNTKNCPFCGKEISDEAIICKHCHRLLIDENGKDILRGAAEDTIPAAGQSAPEEPQEDKTRVFSKDELLRAMNEPEEAAEQEQYEAPGEEDPSAVGEDYYYENEPDAGYPAEEEYYEDNAYTEGYYDENDPNGAPAPLSDEEFFREFGMRKSDMRQPASDEYDPKRTFAVTAIITFGILVVVVGAVIVGSKLFDMKDAVKTDSQPKVTQQEAPQETAPTEPAPTETVTDDPNFVPAVTDDTLSESPEVIGNSSLTDPASTTDPSVVVVTPTDSTSTQSTSDTSSNDPLSVVPGQDSSASDTSSALPTGEGAPSFAPSGNYYNWSEAEQLMREYAEANGLGEYSYYGGTDGVEMIFAVYDESGNPTLYRVDLVTGFVSPY